jgi:hypothetical protein
LEEWLLQIENLSVESQLNKLCYAACGNICKLFL